MSAVAPVSTFWAAIRMSKKIYGLVGRKLGHSYSAAIHNMLGNDEYKLYELEPSELGGFARRDDIGAFNVTIPYKTDIIPFLDHVSPEAVKIGSVNTVVRRNGELWGYNTDLFGVEYGFSRAGIALAGKKTVIFGSGGSSSTVRAAAEKAGAAEIVTISRSGEDNYNNLNRHSDAQILVNTTPLGMYPKPGEFAADSADFPQCEGVFDLIYNPLRTAFLLRAEEMGIKKRANGLSMLAAQAVRAHELFFGITVPDGEIEFIIKKIYADKQNIVLIGMPGSGKTTVGRALGALTGREVIDTDEIVERTAGRSIPEIFAESGEDAFRELERGAIRESGMRSGVIICTGGGAVKDPHNLAPLRQNGRIYRLNRSLELLAREGRPLSGGDLSALADEREPLYTRFADVTIPANGSIEQTVKLIWEDYSVRTIDK